MSLDDIMAQALRLIETYHRFVREGRFSEAECKQLATDTIAWAHRRILEEQRK